MTDSSYDSLENELDDTSSGGSPSLSRHRHRPIYRHHRPPRGSLDSVLTLSDLDPDCDARTATLSVGGAAAGLDPWSPGHGRRRQSEPALVYTAKLAACDAREEEPPRGGGFLPLPRSPGGEQDQRGSPTPKTPPRSPLETLRDWARGRGSPPREPLSWGTLKGTSRGLHPNSWLKETRRMSLTQDHPGTPGGDGGGRVSIRRPPPAQSTLAVPVT